MEWSLCVRERGEGEDRTGEQGRKGMEQQLALRLTAAAAAVGPSLDPAVPPRSLTPDPSHRVKGEREKI